MYNRDVIEKISGLKGDALDDFMLYCNAFNKLPTNATTIEVEQRIRELLVEYNEKHSKVKTP